MKDNLFSTHELGGLLGVTRQTIRNWIKKGDIKAHQIGQNLKIPIEEVTRLLSYYGLPFPDWLCQKTPILTDQAAVKTQQTWTKTVATGAPPKGPLSTGASRKTPAVRTLEAGSKR